MALVKVSALFAYMDNDFGRPGRIITTPVAFGRRRTGEKIGQPLRTGRKFLCEICAAAEENYKADPGKDWDDLPALHSTADASHIVRECNGQRQCKIMGNRRCQRSNLNAVAEAAGKTNALFQP